MDTVHVLLNDIIFIFIIIFIIIIIIIKNPQSCSIVFISQYIENIPMHVLVVVNNVSVKPLWRVLFRGVPIFVVFVARLIHEN